MTLLEARGVTKLLIEQYVVYAGPARSLGDISERLLATSGADLSERR